VVNQPRIYCPKCGKAARRIYYQDAADKKAASNWKPISSWAYCTTDDECFESD
jgi:hypothetical protein